MHNPEIELASVIVEDRMRKDLDLESDGLLESIRKFGIIQPVVLNFENRLIAGERRYRCAERLGWKTIPFVRKETLNERQLTILELEENIRRKSMNWKEEVMAIHKVHLLKKAEATEAGDDWTYAATGRLLNMSTANVGFVRTVARELADSKSPIHACEGFTDALRWILRRNEDLANAEEARLFQESMIANQKKVTIAETPVMTSTDLVQASASLTVEPIPDGVDRPRRVIPISKQFLNGDSLIVLPSLPEACVDHCLTDPPYAINMDMLEQQNPHGGMQNIDRIRETHDVDSNLVLLEKLFPEVFRVLKPRGFFVLFADVMNWQFLYDHAIKAGFKVQRWPLIWHKTSQCMNQAAQFNFTKNYEIAMVCRKQGATLVKDQQTSVFSCERNSYISNPFAKPETLWDWLVDAISTPGQTILDPFAGEGSSVRSVISKWRFPLAIEIDPKHYNVMLDEARKKYDIMYRNPTYV